MKPRIAVPSLVLAALLGLAACGGGSDDSDSGGSTVHQAPAAGQADELTSDLDSAYADDAGGSESSARGVAAEAPAPEEQGLEVERSVIRKGDVALRADDVGKAQFEVQKVVDRLGGQMTDEKTTTDDEGAAAYTRMVLRIPTDAFDEAVDQLKTLEGTELESADSNEVDVTAKVIDTRTRLAAQRRSIARITVLFDRAESIRDIMRIESELSRRQADLESLERQAAFLRSQTSMSTITVSIDQIPPAKAVTEEDTDEAGFLAGLSAGWDALAAFALALATAFGALLPWLVLLGVLGLPAYLIWRRRRVSGGGTGRTPSAA